MMERIIPIEADGLKLMSMGFLLRDQTRPSIWRGPMLHGAITQFLQQTDWGQLDYLIIDMPPGTGDVALTLSQMLGLTGAVVVCTPQEVALLDAVKAIAMFRKVKIPMLGMVENMSGDIFGRGGARRRRQKWAFPSWAKSPRKRRSASKGTKAACPPCSARTTRPAAPSNMSPAAPHWNS